MKKGLIKIWPTPRGAIRQQDLLLEIAKFVESSGRSWVNHKQCNRETIRSTNFDSLSFSSSLLVCTRTLKGLSDKRLSRSYAYPRPRLPRRPVNCISIRIPEVGSPISMFLRSLRSSMDIYTGGTPVQEPFDRTSQLTEIWESCSAVSE